MASQLATEPPKSPTYLLSYPAPGVLLATINRQGQMNSIPTAGHMEGQVLWEWYDNEPSLRCAIVTGAGPKAFCAGADLMEQRDISQTADRKQSGGMSESGFAGLSMRTGKKPIIAAVNGYALGGGFEICLNQDLVIASPSATFGLPEVERGLYAGAGGLPRIVRNLSMQLASELALTSRKLTAQEAKDLQLVNQISKTPASLIDEAVKLAGKIASLSPDAIIVTRAGLREAWKTGNVQEAFHTVSTTMGPGLMNGENIKIGLEAFAKRQQPKWVPSKL